jgi:ribosomal protein L34E
MASSKRERGNEEEPNAEHEWATLSVDILSGMRDWRTQHPHASLGEIEAALDERLARLRARMLETLAQASPAADWAHAHVGDRPRCPACGELLQARGKRTRRLKTQGGQELTLRREYGSCPACGRQLFPPR